jgi:hypothetical protein
MRLPGPERRGDRRTARPVGHRPHPDRHRWRPPRDLRRVRASDRASHGRGQADPTGRTEPETFRDTLALHGIAPPTTTSRFRDALAAGYTAMTPRLRERGRALPGAADALAALAATPGVIQSVLTGNWSRVSVNFEQADQTAASSISEDGAAEVVDGTAPVDVGAEADRVVPPPSVARCRRRCSRQRQGQAQLRRGRCGSL